MQLTALFGRPPSFANDCDGQLPHVLQRGNRFEHALSSEQVDAQRTRLSGVEAVLQVANEETRSIGIRRR